MSSKTIWIPVVLTFVYLVTIVLGYKYLTRDTCIHGINDKLSTKLVSKYQDDYDIMISDGIYIPPIDCDHDTTHLLMKFKKDSFDVEVRFERDTTDLSLLYLMKVIPQIESKKSIN